MLTETASAASAVRGGLEILRGIAALKSEHDRNAAVINVQRVLLEAQEALQAADARVAELQRQVSEFEGWQRERDRYELADLGNGNWVLRLKAADQAGEPIHCICPKCAEDRKKSILQARRHQYNGAKLLCNRCSSEYFTKASDPHPRRVLSPSVWSRNDG